MTMATITAMQITMVTTTIITTTTMTMGTIMTTTMTTRTIMRMTTITCLTTTICGGSKGWWMPAAASPACMSRA
jgi:hypothetical protein